MAVATSGLVFEFVGAYASGSGPGVNSPLTDPCYEIVADTAGDLVNFEGTTSSGYAGDGTESDPYTLVFDGTDTYVDFGDMSALELTEMTFECWMYCTGGHQYGRLMRKRTGSYGFTVYIDTTNNQVRFSATYATTGDSDQLYTPGITILNNWHHLVFTYDETSGELWCHVNGGNGLSGYSGITYKSGAIVPDTTTTVRLGNNNADTTRPYGGKLPTVRVYDRPLSQSEVEGNFQAGKIAVATSMLAAPVIDAYQSDSSIIVDWT